MRKRNKSLISVALAFIMAITQFNPVPARAGGSDTNLSSGNSKYGTAQAGWDWEGTTGVRITIATNSGGAVATKDFFKDNKVSVDAWVTGSSGVNTKLGYLGDDYTASIVEADPNDKINYEYDTLPNLPRTVSGSVNKTDEKQLFDYFSLKDNQKLIFDLMGTPNEHDDIDTIYDGLVKLEPEYIEEYYLILEPLAIANVTIPGESTKHVVMSAGDAIAWNNTTISDSYKKGIMASKAPSIIDNLQLGLKLSDEDKRLDLGLDTYKSGERDASNLNEALKGGWGVAIIRWSADIYSSITCYVDENRNGKFDSGEEIGEKPLGTMMVDLLNLGGDVATHSASQLWGSIKTMPSGLSQTSYTDGDRTCWFKKIYATRDKNGVGDRLLTEEISDKADSSTIGNYIGNVYTDADSAAESACPVSAKHGGVHYFAEYLPPITATIQQYIRTSSGGTKLVPNSKQTSPVEIREGKDYVCSGVPRESPFQGVLFPLLKVPEWETCTYEGVEYKFEEAGYQFDGGAERFSSAKSMNTFAHGTVFRMDGSLTINIYYSTDKRTVSIKHRTIDGNSLDDGNYYSDPSRIALKSHTWNSSKGAKIMAADLAAYGYSTDFNIVKNSDSTKSYQFDHLVIKGGSAAGTYTTLARTTSLLVDDNIEIIVYYKTETVKIKPKHVTSDGTSLAGGISVSSGVAVEDKQIEVEKRSKVTKKNFQQLQASASFKLIEKDGKFYTFKKGTTTLAEGPATFDTISAATLESYGYIAESDSEVKLIYEETDAVKFQINYYDDTDKLITNAKRADGVPLENPKEVTVQRDGSLDMSDTDLANYLNESFKHLIDLDDSAVTYQFSRMSWSINGEPDSSNTLAPPPGKVPTAVTNTIIIKVFYKKSNDVIVSVRYVDENNEPVYGISKDTKETLKDASHEVAAGAKLKNDTEAKGYIDSKWETIQYLDVEYEFDKCYCTIGSNQITLTSLITEGNVPDITFKSSTQFTVVYKTESSKVDIEFVDDKGNSLDSYTSVIDSSVVAKDKTVEDVPNGTILNSRWFKDQGITDALNKIKSATGENYILKSVSAVNEGGSSTSTYFGTEAIVKGNTTVTATYEKEADIKYVIHYGIKGTPTSDYATEGPFNAVMDGNGQVVADATITRGNVTYGIYESYIMCDGEQKDVLSKPSFNATALSHRKPLADNKEQIFHFWYNADQPDVVVTYEFRGIQDNLPIRDPINKVVEAKNVGGNRTPQSDGITSEDIKDKWFANNKEYTFSKANELPGGSSGSKNITYTVNTSGNTVTFWYDCDITSTPTPNVTAPPPTPYEATWSRSEMSFGESAVIKSDTRGSEYYNVSSGDPMSGAIPSGKSEYTNIVCNDLLWQIAVKQVVDHSNYSLRPQAAFLYKKNPEGYRVETYRKVRKYYLDPITKKVVSKIVKGDHVSTSDWIQTEFSISTSGMEFVSADEGYYLADNNSTEQPDDSIQLLSYTEIVPVPVSAPIQPANNLIARSGITVDPIATPSPTAKPTATPKPTEVPNLLDCRDTE